ncbi:MAG: NADH-quinone oxidoreductase subunit B family protein [Candidatus Aenigmatarchaeota archaeon]
MKSKNPSVKQRLINYCRKRSVWILPFNSGGCNGCAIELLSCISPRSDVERFGIVAKGSPRHADVLVVDGPVTTKMKERLLRVYHQMPEPKMVVALGSCTASNGVFDGCYNVCGPLDRIIPVDVWVPGCPPRPEAIIQGILKAMEKIERMER